MATQRHTYKKTQRRIYQSMQAMLADAKHDRKSMPWGTPSSKEDSDYKNEWAGCSPVEAWGLARSGWEGVVAETDALASRITDAVVKQRIVTRWESARDTYGGRVDVGRYLAGEPDCMVRTKRVKRRGNAKVVRIVIPTTYSCSVSETTVRKRGAAVVALVDVLNRAGNRLEVWAHNQIRVGDNRESIATMVQDPAEPVNMARIMFALAHPGWLRRIIFGVQENPAVWPEAWIVARGGGYGNCISTPPQAGDIPGDGDGPTVVLPALQGNGGWSVEESVEWIIRELDRIMVED
jgi:hypothetical protein